MPMLCPKCRSTAKVCLTRQAETETIRIRTCKKCGYRFTTVEFEIEYLDGMDKISDWFRKYYKDRKEKYANQSEIPRKH